MQRALADAGFDIAHAFDAAVLAREPGLEALAAHGRVGLLVGNTRALWRPFLAAADLAPPDPLQRYTEAIVARALPGHRIFYAHRRYAERTFLPFQRLAVAAGLAALAPTHLLVHPIYGPWFALRAVAFTDGEPPTTPAVSLPCACGVACTSALARATSTNDWRDWLAVRDACPIGRAHRYGDPQIGYHYTKDRSWLRG